MSSINFGGIASGITPEISSLSNAAPASGQSFGSVLSNAVQSVDQLHTSAAQQVSTMLQGGGGDLNQVMVAVEKADVAFQLVMQVRNKIVNAYQEIEKMQF